MLRFGCLMLSVLLLLGGCAKPKTDSRLLDLEERVRRSEEQLAISRSEVASLRGELDRLQDSIDAAAQDDPEPPPPPPPQPPAPSRPVISEPETLTEPPVPVPQQPAMEPEPKRPPAPRQEKPQRQRTEADPKREYEMALSLLRSERDSERARTAFQDFLKSHPGHMLEPNATYWLAESYYVEGRFPESILIFKDVVDRFSAHPKAADSLLKIALAYEGLGDTVNARFYLRMLASEYPGSEAAQKVGADGERSGG